jgi:uracil-DNA glycosylase
MGAHPANAGFAQLAAPDAWADLRFFATQWPRIAQDLAQETRQVLPPPADLFAALTLCPPAKVRVVILGQDPYPTPGHAHGLAFSAASETTPLPRSLANIFKELRGDLGASPSHADLRFWAHQGVLLLNTALSVPAGLAGGHAKLGWAQLTTEVLARLNTRARAYLLWGRHAQAFAGQITHPKALILTSAHPSPLSARRGFFGARPFSRVNDWLIANGDTPINWTTP